MPSGQAGFITTAFHPKGYTWWYRMISFSSKPVMAKAVPSGLQKRAPQIWVSVTHSVWQCSI